jgi:hypothetical protein
MPSTLDLTGYWQTRSGTVYKFFTENGFLVGIYFKPNSTQISYGIEAGDLAFKGTLVGEILSGEFHHCFPLEIKQRCPGMYLLVTPMALKVSKEGDKLTGLLLNTHLPDDSCTPDDRRLEELVFERSDPDRPPKSDSIFALKGYGSGA